MDWPKMGSPPVVNRSLASNERSVGTKAPTRSFGDDATPAGGDRGD
jgi:hypothetical protein